MTNYFYLDVTLELDTEIEIDISALYLKKHIIDSLNSLFGEVGASIPVDILKYQQDVKRAILRVPEDYFVKLYSSLTLSGKYHTFTCAYRVHKTSPNLISLISDSRKFEY